MIQDATADLLAQARRVRAGIPQAGQEHIHAEWLRLLNLLAGHILDEDLAQFTRWSTIAQTMFIGDYGDTARQLDALRARPDWTSRWEPALVESDVGGLGHSGLHAPSSGNQIRQAYTLARFEDAAGRPLNAFDRIVEFGGGFGAMCLLASRLGFRGEYIIVDNEPVRGLQRWYLLQHGLDVASSLPNLPASLPEGQQAGAGISISSVATSELERALTPVDDRRQRIAFIANWSLSETPLAFRNLVFRTLRRTLVDAIWVTYQRSFGDDNARYFLGKLPEFADVYETSVRPFQPDAPAGDYYFGHACLSLTRVPGRQFPLGADGLEPAPFETAEMRQLTIDELHARIRAAITARRPLSVLRLGDGEARIIGYPKYISKALVADIWHTWFGRADFTDDQVSRVRDALKDACLGADAIGVPQAEADMQSEFGRVKALLPREGFIERETPLCHAGFHLRFHRESRYPALLEGLPRIGVIGPRDTADALKRLTGVPEVIWFEVPPEMKFSDLPDEVRTRMIATHAHLTRRYEELMEAELPRALDHWPGLVVLVGAGVLGKIYCQRIKQLGGVGLDVGSMMDVWAGLKTRDNQKFDGLRPVLR